MTSKRPAKKMSSTKESKPTKKPVASKKVKSEPGLKIPKTVGTKVASVKSNQVKKVTQKVGMSHQKPTKPVKVSTKPVIKKSTPVKASAKKTVLSDATAKTNTTTVKSSGKSKSMSNKNTDSKAAPSEPISLANYVSEKKNTTKKPHALEKIITPPEVLVDENYMDEEQREHFRQILLDWKRQLLEEMERTVHHMQDEAGSFADPNDRATQEEEFSLELRARDRERKLIKKIEEALQRLDHNEYGYCEACGVEIGVKRLEARPTATLCIDCKTIDEIREKHYG